jgi:hypothetical protein
VIASATAATAAGVGAARAAARRRGGPERPLVVTVNRPVEEVAGELVAEGEVTGPLADVPGAVDIELRPAPGDRGTEIVASLGDPRGGTDPVRRGSRVDRQAALREALRLAKQVLETGEVLSPDHPGTSEKTLLNAPLRAATARGRKAGRL